MVGFMPTETCGRWLQVSQLCMAVQRILAGMEHLRIIAAASNMHILFPTSVPRGHAPRLP